MIKHVDLPSGAWWDIETDPAWGKLKGLTAEMGDAGLLAQVTAGWSFPEAVSPETVNLRRTSDVIAALEVVFQDVLPLFGRLQGLQRLSTAPSGTES